MGDITNLFGGPFTGVEERHVASPEDQLRDAFLAIGITPPDELIFDGRIHRFASGTGKKGRRGDDSGFYVIYPDGVPSGVYGDWRTDQKLTFRADVGRELDAAEQMMISRRVHEARQIRQAEEAKRKEVVSDVAEAIWSNAVTATNEHPYLVAKGIDVHGARVTGDGRLVLPMYIGESVSSLQYIDTDGGKRYHGGGATKDAFWWIGDNDTQIYLAEGFATAASIQESTGCLCYIAYSAANLPGVARMIKERHGSSPLTIVADNDESGTGTKYAQIASEATGARVVVPPALGDANDYLLSGGDLSALLAPPRTEWLVPSSEYRKQPAPLRWLVKHWLQDDALHMIHGPSGSGKTFLLLDMLMHVASGRETWREHKVRPGPVVYLAGEGHHGLRGRLAAWAHYHKVDEEEMWISRSGCDLNTPKGEQQVIQEISALPVPPRAIAIDTLHRFLSGDENSAQDTKTMLDACASLMARFKCAVILVHHTGNAEEAQHRARGSSAWRGALDIEISVVPGKDGGPMEIVQRKSKDTELAPEIFAKLEKVAIPGWVDEDGEQVTSAVIVETEAPVKGDEKLKDARRFFELAWDASGCEIMEDSPYISKSYLRTVYEQKGRTPDTARKYAAGTNGKGEIGVLIDQKMIDKCASGWRVIDRAWASAMQLNNIKSV